MPQPSPAAETLTQLVQIQLSLTGSLMRHFRDSGLLTQQEMTAMRELAFEVIPPNALARATAMALVDDLRENGS